MNTRITGVTRTLHGPSREQDQTNAATDVVYFTPSNQVEDNKDPTAPPQYQEFPGRPELPPPSYSDLFELQHLNELEESIV